MGPDMTAFQTIPAVVSGHTVTAELAYSAILYYAANKYSDDHAGTSAADLGLESDV